MQNGTYGKESELQEKITYKKNKYKMPAKSQAQQRFFGMVDAYQKGELPKNKASKAIRRAADDMTRKEVKKFAKTKHKGLPEKVDEETMEQKPVKESVRINRDQLRNIVAEAVRKCINEAESGGWVVEADEAELAYDFAAQELGNEELNAAIVRAMGDNTLAQILAYLFRMYDLRGWEEYRDEHIDEYRAGRF